MTDHTEDYVVAGAGRGGVCGKLLHEGVFQKVYAEGAPHRTLLYYIIEML